MSFSDSLRVIGEIERSFDVNTLCYEGVCVWPIIRNEIAACPELSDFDKTIRDPRNGKYDLWTILPDPAQLDSLKQYSGVEYLFYTRAEEHHTRMQGRYYGFVDPYLEIVKDRHSVLKMELNSGHVPGTSPRYYPTVFLKNTMARMVCPVANNDINHFQTVRQLVRSMCPLDLDEGIIIETVNQTEQYRVFFLDVLRRIQPRVVLMVCYYTNPPAMGLIRACRDMGIPTVELKHGFAPDSPYYDHWTRIPDNGYEYLPDLFYVWSEQFRQGVESKRPQGCAHHRAIVGPNEWMRKVLQDPLPPIDGVDYPFLEDLKKRKKVILITLGFPTDVMPVHLLEAMQKAPQDWLWLVRRHPRHKRKKDNFIESLSSYGISNVELQKSTDHPLFLLLTRSHYHLTRYSSSCLEAMLYGISSTLYYPSGYDCFRDYVDQGYLNYEPIVVRQSSSVAADGVRHGQCFASKPDFFCDGSADWTGGL